MWEVAVPSPKPSKLEIHYLSPVRDCLMKTSTAFHIWGPSPRSAPRRRALLCEKDQLNTGYRSSRNLQITDVLSNNASIFSQYLTMEII